MPENSPSLFLCGPMNMYFKKGWRLFLKHEKICISRGFSVLNPIRSLSDFFNKGDIEKFPDAKIDPASWRNFIKHILCQNYLIFCDGLYLIPGWGSCYMASAYVQTALEFDIPIFALINGCVIQVDYVDLEYHYGICDITEPDYDDNGGTNEDDDDDDDDTDYGGGGNNGTHSAPIDRTVKNNLSDDDNDDLPKYSFRHLSDVGRWVEKQMKPKMPKE